MDTSGTDSWTALSNGWRRIYLEKRTKLYFPEGPGSPESTSLGDVRVTEMTFEDGSTLRVEDNWRAEDPELLAKHGVGSAGKETWTGHTKFYFKDTTEHTFADPLQTETEKAKNASSLPIPEMPSEAERRAHNLTHFPFQKWCRHCTSGKGREDDAGNKKGARELRGNTVQFDYADWITSDTERVHILTGYDTSTGMSMGVVVPATGELKHSTAEICKFLLETNRTCRPTVRPRVIS